MWYVIFISTVIWIIYHYNKEKTLKPAISTIAINYDNEIEEYRKQKAISLSNLKKSFQLVSDNNEVLEKSKVALVNFLENHYQSISEIENQFEKLKIPDDLIKKETFLRKEINKYYKNREDQKSKTFAIYLSFEHAKLLLQHPDVEWKNFIGLEKLQNNWKAEEYFNELLLLMYAFQKTFPKSSNVEKLSKDIERIFELWNSRNIEQANYRTNLQSFSNIMTISDKYFVIHEVIKYLYRRSKFNPKYIDELIEWYHKDIEFYKDYNFSCLNSFNALEEIYEQEQNVKKLNWLRDIGQHIDETNLQSFLNAKTASDKHFIILNIIGYLKARSKFNPEYKYKLIDWCLKDIELYEQFLKELHKHDLFTIDDLVQFNDNPNLRKKKFSAVHFDHVKNLENYMVPRLNSFDILEEIYEQEQNVEKIHWLQSIGQHIGYRNSKDK